MSHESPCENVWCNERSCHEPECPSPDCTEKCPGYEQCDHECRCTAIRAGYKHGRDDAARAVFNKEQEFLPALYKNPTDSYINGVLAGLQIARDAARGGEQG